MTIAQSAVPVTHPLRFSPGHGTIPKTRWGNGMVGDYLINGDFATDSDWTKGTGWTIAASAASSDGTQLADSDLTQTPQIPLVQGQSYDITYTVSGLTAGTVVAVVGDQEGTPRTADGVYTETIIAGAGADIDIRADVDFVGSVKGIAINNLVASTKKSTKYSADP